MKKILLVLVSIALCLPMLARPAKPGPISYLQPDGSVIKIFLHGDEWGHWASNEQGKVLTLDAEGFYRVNPDTDFERESAAAARKRAYRRQQMESRSQASDRHVAVGQKHFLVILVAFNDLDFKTENPQETVYSQLNDPGYSGNGATGSARDFYYDSSNGYFEPIFDVYGPVKLSKNMASYGGNNAQGGDKDPEGAVAEACQLLDDEVDFARYDNDGDGKVDMVFMIYAGYGEADGGSANTIWPHMYYLTYSGINLKLDGKKLDKYACANELAGQGALRGKLDGIGAVCHEFGHTMGLPDFYDTDYTTNGETRGTYDFSVMCEGSYNNESRTPPFFNTEERILLGWADESALLEFPRNGEYQLEAFRPDLGNTTAYMIPTEMEGEYFLVECRGNQSWDSALSGNGLVVYHADKSSRTITLWKGTSYQTSVSASTLWSNWESYNAINENGSHPCFYTVCAASQSSYNYSRGSDNIVFPGKSKVTSYTPKSWDGEETEIVLSKIAYADNVASFTVMGKGSSALGWPIINNPGKGSYKAGKAFNLSLQLPQDYELDSVEWTFDGEVVTATSVNLTAGTHVVEATVVKKDGDKDVVTLEITAK